MFDIKNAKNKARKNVKRHYVIFVIICLLATVLGSEFKSTLASIQTTSEEKILNASSSASEFSLTADEVFNKILEGSIDESAEIAKGIQDSKQTSNILGLVELGHKNGVLSGLVNNISSGQFLITIFQTIYTLTKSESLALDIFIVLSALVMLLVFVFLKGVFKVAYRRTFLESYKYEEVKLSSLTFIFRVNRFVRVAFDMFVQSALQLLWDITIIGGIIKKYEYAMTPYIVAENPDIDAFTAIDLSKDMMRGHKFELFKVELTFIGWWILGAFSLGISEIIYSNPFKEATMLEYYVYVRDLAKKNNVPNIDLLNDKYLFEYASNDLLRQAYSDVVEIMEDDIVLEDYMHTGFRGFIENNLGIIYKYDSKEDGFNVAIEQEEKIDHYKHVLDLTQYPERLLDNYKEKVGSRLEETHYLRHYDIWSVVVLFFVFCFIGWSWEVMLHLVEDGVFVNRGVNHGPWLPIYGSGGVLILLFLYRFRKNVGLEAISALVLCGTVEYFTHWFLEVTKGTKWWDYSGYFININGRICAEGLLVFMLGGLAIVYILAPKIDNLVRKANRKILIPICVLLLITFGIDAIYSSKHPNTGKGITDYNETVVVINKNNL